MNSNSTPHDSTNGENVQGDDRDDDLPRINCFTPFLEHGLRIDPAILEAWKRRGLKDRSETPLADSETGHE